MRLRHLYGCREREKVCVREERLCDGGGELPGNWCVSERDSIIGNDSQVSALVLVYTASLVRALSFPPRICTYIHLYIHVSCNIPVARQLHPPLPVWAVIGWWHRGTDDARSSRLHCCLLRYAPAWLLGDKLQHPCLPDLIGWCCGRRERRSKPVLLNVASLWMCVKGNAI